LVNCIAYFFSGKGIPSPQEKAKAVYFVLISQGKAIIQDILNSTPDKFRDSEDYKAFLANEIGVVMCLNSTREGYERFFEDSQGRELFSATLFPLFKNHLHVPWDVFQLYINLGEDHEEPDKIFMQLFAGRIFAFLDKDDELFNKPEKALMYSWDPEALIYVEYYTRIFEMVYQILNEYAGKSANSGKVLEMAKKLDEYLR
jgi:hypothetical protein